MNLNFDQNIQQLKRSILDKIHKFCNKKYNAVYLRSIHYLSPNIISFVFLFFSKTYYKIATAIFYLAFILFFLFDGCILFDFDKEYFDDDVNMCDPFLDFIGVELNDDNRYDINSLTYFFSAIFIIILYVLRFDPKYSVYYPFKSFSPI